MTRLYESFVRRGANLTPEQKQQLSAYNQQLARLFAEFSEKVLADESTYITATEAELAGRPSRRQRRRRRGRAERKLPAGSFAIVNTRSAVDPVLTFADNRALREKVWRAFVNRGDNGDANDTNATIAEIVKTARRPRPAARLREPRPLADAGHDGQVAGQARPGPDECGSGPPRSPG